VRLDGQALDGLPESELAVIRREKIGFVFQSFNLVPVLTAAENVAVPLLLAGRRGAAVREPVERMLALAGLTERQHHRPAELSGGQQQRVAIARALVMDPLVVLADEPTGNLDSRTGAEVMKLLRRSCDERKQTFVVITHDEAVAAWADRVVRLSDGVIVEGAATHA
ncbi:MAG TPA: ABC transporter ATP-binding protein, partial [Symbiobacteriaceae bacterium]|nr:ABC transporter ATP-binding protein [Symbiobacteriaceae bacterium]